ncbi:hypothetical protein MCUN1_001556 [Malassezia cuniculi]|uniref:Vacuolar protein sorting-associated protein 8 central domain-containing protein n=1 Tax=Malassezia cuniculi TaxID=948313 RepID=A0AAF0EU96_9BASI|nr:hypothetical protein MCUN1_001556 [Malassezia cuniculi]
MASSVSLGIPEPAFGDTKTPNGIPRDSFSTTRTRSSARGGRRYSIASGVSGRRVSMADVSDAQPATEAGTSRAASFHDSSLPIARPFLEMHVLRHLSDQAVTETGESMVRLHISSGLILVGMSQGTTLVFDLAQRFRCACRPPESYGEVSALALSHDGSCAGVGYQEGHIVLFDLLESGVITRHVTPVSHEQVISGRCEGHLAGARITKVQFVGSRRTAIVTADSNGLCFYHSLGRMLGFPSNDTHLLAGDYETVTSLLDVAALLPGLAHRADEHLFVALLVDRRIQLVGIAPSPRTWYTSEPGAGDTGALAWFPTTSTSTPMLAAALGRALRIIHLRTARVRRPDDEPSPAVVLHIETLEPAPEPIVRLQWVHQDLLLVITACSWLLYDFAAKAYTEWQPHDPEISGSDPADLYIWRSRGFCVANSNLYVGRFVPWDDRLKKLAAAGEYSHALELCAGLYVGAGIGSAIGLPPAGEERQKVIAERLGELQVAACRHVFRTGGDTKLLAHALVASVAAAGTDELTNEWYDLFEHHGAEDILVAAMEEYILRGALRRPPPAAMQRLLDYCAREHQYARLESLVLHVELTSLDLEQTLHLCGEHHLWGALIHVYNEALHDYVTPISALLRGALLARTPTDTWTPSAELADAYSLFSYLGAVLQGKAYPSLDAVPRERAEFAAAAVGQVLYARSPNVELLDGEYPLLVLSLKLDASALLEVLDEAFECDLFSDDDGNPQLPSRAQVIDALLDVRRVGDISAQDAAFVAVFVARNAPKFPQFVKLATQDVEALFEALCTFDGHEPRAADREYALECLLSAYSVPSAANLVAALEKSQFWHVLETVLRRARDWDSLLAMYMQGHTIGPAPGQLYERGLAALGAGARPAVLLEHVTEVPDGYLGDLALLADRRVDHAAMIDVLDSHRQFIYLRALFSRAPPMEFFHAWISLVAVHAPAQLIQLADIRGADLEHVRASAEAHGVYDALVWACNRLGRPAEGLQVLGSFAAQQGAALSVLAAANEHASGGALECALERTRSHVEAFGTALRVALGVAAQEKDVHEHWYLVLRALLEFFGSLGGGTGVVYDAARSGGHELLETTLATMAAAPSDALAFSTLLERLLNASTNTFARAAVRAVVDGMLDAQRLCSDVLALGVQLGEADVARLFRELARVRALGVLVPSGQRVCHKCGLTLGPERAAAPNGTLWHQSCIDNM